MMIWGAVDVVKRENHLVVLEGRELGCVEIGPVLYSSLDPDQAMFHLNSLSVFPCLHGYFCAFLA